VTAAGDALVRDNPDGQRFEIVVDGQVVGFAEYRDRGQVRSFVHTEVDRAFEGRGLAGQLIAYALADARDRGLAVLPFCPFVRAFIERHREFLDLVPEMQRARFQLDGTPDRGVPS
jgi:uncharacterized protein